MRLSKLDVWDRYDTLRVDPVVPGGLARGDAHGWLVLGEEGRVAFSRGIFAQKRLNFSLLVAIGERFVLSWRRLHA